MEISGFNVTELANKNKKIVENCMKIRSGHYQILSDYQDKDWF